MRLLGQELDIAKVFGKETISVQEVKKLRKILGKDKLIHKESWEKELDEEINQFLDQPYFTQEWEKVYHKLRLNLKSFIRTEIEKAKHSQLKEIREWAKEKQDGIEYEIKMANDKSVKSHFSGQHKAFSDLLKELEK